jgi:hypothetical protein
MWLSRNRVKMRWFTTTKTYSVVMLKGRPGFEAGPRPRPIWACQAQPGFRPSLNKIKEFKLFFYINFWGD